MEGAQAVCVKGTHEAVFSAAHHQFIRKLLSFYQTLVSKREGKNCQVIQNFSLFTALGRQAINCELLS